jgi:toxin-antitoxin system PIN domain toxin
LVLPDVNVLVYAHREDSVHHRDCLRWLEATLAGEARYAVSELVLSSFIRVVTHPKIFNAPSSLHDALTFAEQVREQPNAFLVEPGERHWPIFRRLCNEAKVRGNLVPDAYLAALAIESGCEWITTDRDFSRFPGLKWRSPV